MAAEPWRRAWAMGADVGGAPQSGCTPLHAAAYFGKEAVAQVLLKAGVDNEAKGPVRARDCGEGAVD